jgi:hypothetical protein
VSALWGREPGREVVRRCEAGRTKRSAIDDAWVCVGSASGSGSGDGGGGERAMRIGKLPTPDERDCCFVSVGVNAPSSSLPSSERNREDRRDSRSSSWKFVEVRYRTVRVRVPVGWGMASKDCVAVGRGSAVGEGRASVFGFSWDAREGRGGEGRTEVKHVWSRLGRAQG